MAVINLIPYDQYEFTIHYLAPDLLKVLLDGHNNFSSEVTKLVFFLALKNLDPYFCKISFRGFPIEQNMSSSYLIHVKGYLFGLTYLKQFQMVIF